MAWPERFARFWKPDRIKSRRPYVRCLAADFKAADMNMQTTLQSQKKLAEMRRLYEKDELTLRQIADRFGITRQAVHQRLTRAGVNMRPRSTRRMTLERDLLYDLYVVGGKTIVEVAAAFGVSMSKILTELKRYGIGRRKSGPAPWKYVGVYNLKLQESVIVPRPTSAHPHQNLYSTAKRIGIKITVRKVDESRMLVTRVS